MENIASALDAAGWVRVKWATTSPIEFPLPNKPSIGWVFDIKGIRIEVADEKWQQWSPVMRSLHDALACEGVTTVGIHANRGTATPDAIHILIGQKESSP